MSYPYREDSQRSGHQPPETSSPPELAHYSGQSAAYYDRESFFQPTSQPQRYPSQNHPPLPRQAAQQQYYPSDHSHLPQSSYRPDSYADSIYTDTSSVSNGQRFSPAGHPPMQSPHPQPSPRPPQAAYVTDPDVRASVASTAYGDLPIPKVKTTVELTEDEEILANGIQAHEAGRLEESARLFEQAARMNNPNAMFLYGISLRHGWGCTEDPIKAFQYLQRAAEAAVVDLNAQSSDAPVGALSSKRDSIHLGGAQAKSGNVAKKELILAIYELGICFRHGWGVPKNKVTAVYYFDIAANLGDPDAQNEMGFCYSKGEGVKRDMHKAAHYYRLADAQGKPVMGNSWIYKKKYDPK